MMMRLVVFLVLALATGCGDAPADKPVGSLTPGPGYPDISAIKPFVLEKDGGEYRR